MAGIAGGAEAVLIPESEMGPEDLAAEIRRAYERGKAHAIIVVAEGCSNNAERLANYFAEHRGRLGFDLRVTILGLVQRGGAPGAFDRLLATRLGAAATAQLERGEPGALMGLVRGEVMATPLREVMSRKKSPELPSRARLRPRPLNQRCAVETRQPERSISGRNCCFCRRGGS